MNKIFLSLIYLTFYCFLAYAKEPTLAILREANTNEYQKFSIGMYQFICRPYGVTTLEELYKSSKFDASCKQAIREFYVKNPLQEYFVENLLKDRQTYHLEFKENRCVVYAQGKVTISELLLKNGLAINKENFDDKEFNHSFKKSQDYAKRLKLGLHKEDFINRCILEMEK